MNTNLSDFNEPTVTWWRHQTENFSALLTLCEGNSPVTDEFPSQKPVTRSFDVFFNLCLNKRLSKQSQGWWFKTPLLPLWRHWNGYSALNHHLLDCFLKTMFRQTSKQHQSQALLALCEGNPPVTDGFSSQMASDTSWRHHLFSCRTACPVGQYKEGLNSEGCRRCPARSSTELTGSGSAGDCICQPGTRLSEDGSACRGDFNSLKPRQDDLRRHFQINYLV